MGHYTQTAIRPLNQNEILRLGAGQIAQVLTDHALHDPDLTKLLNILLASNTGEGALRCEESFDANDLYLIGESPPMLRVFREIRQFAATDAPVLITGETGTGKELAARAVHEGSSRIHGPFIPINCAGLPPTLVSSELFGHEKGAFTGASQRKIGRIEAARGGTVFLDEIGDFPLELQPHLLRFLQERTIERVGACRPISMDVRVVAATNKDLATEVRASRFREDLFYRLNVLRLHLPPLRERGSDIDLLARSYLGRLAAEMGRKPPRFTDGAKAALRHHDWPGNVREMITRVRRALVTVENDWIKPVDLGFATGERRKIARASIKPISCSDAGDASSQPSGPTGEPQPVLTAVAPLHDASFRPKDRPRTLAEARKRLEEEMIRGALQRNGSSVTSAAAELGVSRVTLYRLMVKHELRSDDEAPAADDPSE